MLALAVATLTATAAPALALAQQDYEVADGRTGGVDQGREDNDEQVYPINYSFYPQNHQPGAQNTGFEVYASGLTENITGHWVVLESQDFGFSNCQPTDASAFGIDRGNDNSGTNTDVSLLTAYKSYTSTEGGIYIEFYKEEQVAGGPIKAYVTDQLVARQNNCMTNPSEPGWYRVNGHINGSTKHDTQTDYEIFAETQYTYICDCANEQEARQQLGPPPNEGGDGGSGGDGGDATATPGSGGGDGSTASPSTDSGGTETVTAGTGDDSTLTRTPTEEATATGTQTATGETDGTAATTQTETADESTATDDDSAGGGVDGTPTPTDGGGPGFGAAAAAFALAAAGLVARRRTR